ncbi:uncharacterized protein LOC129808899, partial [Phlebotomus papatasi]|uniref:uncharacterized protein LOC129808899 n=1 Tax=Phlebotomus papatasi TaxID=29031 RepID=UPI0024842BB9
MDSGVGMGLQSTAKKKRKSDEIEVRREQLKRRRQEAMATLALIEIEEKKLMDFTNAERVIETEANVDEDDKSCKSDENTLTDFEGEMSVLADEIYDLPDIPSTGNQTKTSWDESGQEFDDENLLEETSHRRDTVEKKSGTDTASISVFADKMAQLLSRQGEDNKLPKFNGNPASWPLFYSSYIRTTKSGGYKGDENVLRLQKCLEGDARDAVISLLARPDKADKIIEILKRKFGGDERVARSAIEKARAVPGPKSTDGQTFIKFASAVENLVLALDGIDDNSYLQDRRLLNEFEEKLPLNLKWMWLSHITHNEKARLPEFSEWLAGISKVTADRPKSDRDERTSTTKEFRKTRQVGSVSTKKPSTCSRCAEAHRLEDCPSFKKMSTDERFKFVRTNGLCIRCLKSGHKIRECRMVKQCQVPECTRTHHFLLHVDIKPSKVVTSEIKRDEKVDDLDKAKQVAVCGSNETLLRIIPVTVSNHTGKSLNILALLDSGSAITMMHQEVAEYLELDGPSIGLAIEWVDGTVVTDKNAKVVDFNIKGISERDRKWLIKDAYVVTHLDLRPAELDVVKLKKQYPYLKSIPIPSFKKEKPLLIIGEDNVKLTVPGEVIEGRRNRQPLACRTQLGWVVSGSDGCRNRKPVVACVTERLISLVESTSSTENFGVMAPTAQSGARADKKALDSMQQTVVRKEGRFEVGLLWKKDQVNMPPSRAMAMKRLYYVEKKMVLDSQYAEAYCRKMEEYISKKYLVPVTNEDQRLETGQTWYLPHFGVTNPSKPGKLRIVMDAAAKSEGVSLNTELLKGPDQLTSLTEVLLKFRRGNYAFTGDIEQMFHQVLVRELDQNYQRVLWRGRDNRAPIQEYKMRVLIFGASCSPALAAYVKNKNAEEFRSDFPEAYEAITERHYVDDWLESCDDTDQAKKLIEQVIKIHSKGGFVIRNFIASDQTILSDVPKDLCSSSPTLDLNSDEQFEKVLGIWWDPKEDVLTFRTTFSRIPGTLMSGDKIPTRREILQIVMSIYDPFGMLVHLTVGGKMIMQKVCNKGVDWSEEIDEITHKEWKKWVVGLSMIYQVRVPRCFATKDVREQQVQLHIFCDASSSAFAAVAYLRFGDDQIHVTFVMGKSRLAPPSKTLTIPRLELQAAVLGSRLACTVRQQVGIKINKTYLWSDSRTVLSWIQTDPKKFQDFVGHRVSEINNLTQEDEWKWVPTKLNVADEATRFDLPTDLTPESRWFKGPDFLSHKEASWPTIESSSIVPIAVVQAEEVVIDEKPENNRLIDFNSFSSFWRMIRSMAYVLRFANRVRKTRTMTNFLTVNELNQARNLLISQSQAESFSSEIEILKKGKPLTRGGRLSRLTPEIDSNGLIRMKGRLEKLALRELPNYNNPLILCGKNKFTKLFLEEEHKRLGHVGSRYILAEMRPLYHVIGGRRTLKWIEAHCVFCQKRRAKTIQPMMGQLPLARLDVYQHPFTNTGLDFFGPIDTKLNRSRVKRYGAIFTCLTTRADHLEVCESLTTDSCIMAIHRFVSRRGSPVKIISDNGTNFKGAKRELKEALKEIDQDRIGVDLSKRNIEWEYNPPSAPHMGGAWERLIRSVKRSLEATLKASVPTPEILVTAFAEVESILNGRPLMVLTDNDELLTPNHFLLLRQATYQAPGKFSDDDLVLRKQWRASQRLADIFWTHWVNDYLPVLALRPKWWSNDRQIQVNDLVVIIDNKHDRNSWRRGKIVKIYPGSDGVVRVVD